MRLEVPPFGQILANFLDSWPISRVRNMTIEEYTDIGNHDTFCYQVEWGTEKLGSISGVPLLKFGVWMRKNKKNYKKQSILQDDRYSWLAKYGSDAPKAFHKIRSLISSIIDHAQKGEFDQIEDIDFHSIAKWKIAFLYSQNRLLPIYSREALILIARGLGIKIQSDVKVFQLHASILARKDNQPLVKFAFDLWHKHVANSSQRGFYVIGSKYKRDDGSYEDMFQKMYSKSVVATGFLWNHDLSKLIGAKKEVVYQFVENHREEFEEDLKSVQRTIFLLTALKPGDLIAVKSEGRYNKLTIIAYAQVISIDKRIYALDDVLGQCIHVNYLETDLNIQTGLNYAKTIHRIDTIKKPEDFVKIFGTYSMIDIPVEGEHGETGGEGKVSKDKKTDSYQRSGTQSTTVNLIHNKIQNAFRDFLQTLHPDETIEVEYKNRVDLFRQNKSEVFYYEIKPYNSVKDCIRAGIGQLLQYHFLFDNGCKKSNLVIVGMREPDATDEAFIAYMKKTLSIDFEYEPFNPFS